MQLIAEKLPLPDTDLQKLTAWLNMPASNIFIRTLESRAAESVAESGNRLFNYVDGGMGNPNLEGAANTYAAEANVLNEVIKEIRSAQEKTDDYCYYVKLSYGPERTNTGD